MKEAIRKYLAEKGIDIDAETIWRHTALFETIQGSSIGMLKILIAIGADVNKTNSTGLSPLQWAITWNTTDKAKLLIEEGADINFKDGRNGMTALHYAVRKDNSAIFKLLEKANIDAKDGKGETPLMLAVRCGNFKMVKKLIKKGADINLHNNRTETALIIALKQDKRWKNTKDIIGYLIKSMEVGDG